MSIKDISPTTTPVTQSPTPAHTTTTSRYQVLAVLRIIMGLTFLWAFLDKTFGLGYATTSTQAWIHGGSPTKGFLAHIQVGPLQAPLRAMAGTGWANWLFMLAMLGLGIALILGIGLRVAATTGTLVLALMWFAEFPIARFDSTAAATASTNPFIDYHLVYAAVLITLAVFAAGNTWGLGRRWADLHLVRRNPWLR
jgi:thiosulfate dehydrogenase (quinone) large subunit